MSVSTAGAAALDLISTAQVTIGGLRADASRLARWAELIAGRLHRGGVVLTAGNGGSATHAAHLAGELMGRFRDERRALRAVCLTADGSTLTAVGNDYGFEKVFSRQIEGLAGGDDVVVLFSTSGRSPNVLEAVTAARLRGALILAFTGPAPNPLQRAADDTVAVDGADTACIQDAHHVGLHALCAALDHVLGVAQPVEALT